MRTKSRDFSVSLPVIRSNGRPAHLEIMADFNWQESNWVFLKRKPVKRGDIFDPNGDILESIISECKVFKRRENFDARGAGLGADCLQE